MPLRIAEELRVDPGAVKPAHRSGREPGGADGEDEVRGLESTVVARLSHPQLVVAGEVFAQLGPERQQLAATLGKLYATTTEARSEFAG